MHTLGPWASCSMESGIAGGGPQRAPLTSVFKNHNNVWSVCTSPIPQANCSCWVLQPPPRDLASPCTVSVALLPLFLAATRTRPGPRLLKRIVPSNFTAVAGLGASKMYLGMSFVKQCCSCFPGGLKLRRLCLLNRLSAWERYQISTQRFACSHISIRASEM